MKYLTTIAILILIILVGLVIIKNRTLISTDSHKQSNKIIISTSFYPLYFFTTQIGRDKVSVINITPAGTEPHDYEPTAQDISTISRSRLLILNGGVESWGDKIRSNLQDNKTQIVMAGDGLLNRQLVNGSSDKAIDPHVWLSPRLAKIETQKIAQSLESIDPQNGSYYQANEIDLEKRLDILDDKFRSGLTSCKKKDIVTSHAAFGYLAQTYGLNHVAIAGLSPDAEPSSFQLANVSNFAKKNNIKYIFFESLVSPKLSETIADEIGAEVLVLNPLEGLSNDDIKNGEDYFTVMLKNLENLKLALECN